MKVINHIRDMFRPHAEVAEDAKELRRTLFRARQARGDFDKQMKEFEEVMADLRKEATWLYVNKD